VIAPRFKKWLASALVLGACVMAAWMLGAQAYANPAGGGFQKGTLQVRFTDGNGRAQAAPVIHLANGYPAMPAVTTLLNVSNVGSLPADCSISLGDVPVAPVSLADVLVVRVATPSGLVLYDGPLKGMAFHAPRLLPTGALAAYAIEVRWPEVGSNANRYQGLTLSVALRLSCHSA
jgi:hypothetical protein